MHQRLRLTRSFLGLMISSVLFAQLPPLKPTAEESARLKLLMAEAQEAINSVPASVNPRTNLMMTLPRAYWALGNQVDAHAETQRIREIYKAPAPADSTASNSPSGMAQGRMLRSQLASLAMETAQFGDTADALDIMQEIGYSNGHGLATDMIAVKQAQAGDDQGAC